MSHSVFLSTRTGVWLLQAGGGNGRNVKWRQCWHSLSSSQLQQLRMEAEKDRKNEGKKERVRKKERKKENPGATQPIITSSLALSWFSEHWDPCAVATVATQQPDQWTVISSHICSLMGQTLQSPAVRVCQSYVWGALGQAFWTYWMPGTSEIWGTAEEEQDRKAEMCVHGARDVSPHHSGHSDLSFCSPRPFPWSLGACCLQVRGALWPSAAYY